MPFLAQRIRRRGPRTGRKEDRKQNTSSTSPHNCRVLINRIPALDLLRDAFERAVTLEEAERGNYCRLPFSTYSIYIIISLLSAADNIVLWTEHSTGMESLRPKGIRACRAEKRDSLQKRELELRD